MTEALEVSCNCYFVNLINKIDTEHILSLCKKSGLGRELTLAPGISSAHGILPSEKSLKSKGTLANFAFGQGEFLASPLQITSLYHALTTGNYIAPSLVMGFTNSIGLMTKEKSAEPIKVLSDNAVSLIRKMLSSAGESYNISGGAGKTGTAQSGVYNDGKEILRTWFAGYYPAENPEYIIVILCENGRSGTADCVPVFKEIIKGLD
jgi:cell division protein FtsI/penicillin-binding protein 2